MKILAITQILPYPLDSGPKIKTYHALRSIALEHEVTLVSFVREESTDRIRHLEGFCSSVHVVPMRRGLARDGKFLVLSLIKNHPFTILRDKRREMADLILQLCSETAFDVVHADQLNMAQYAQLVQGTKKILDAHNALWLVYRRLWESNPLTPVGWVYGREWRLLKKYEGDISRSFDRILAVSEEDQNALVEAGVSAEKIVIIPITIDSDAMHPIERDPDARNIFHMGTMFWPPNSEGVEWFLAEVWPHVHKMYPEVNFDIVGSRPSKAIRRLGEQDGSVNVWGYVEDPSRILKSAAVMVVPLRAGSGMRVKILNAMAQQIPVVTTPIGCEGIQVTHGEHLLIAETPMNFASAVLQILEDRSGADRMAMRARALVESKYDYKRILRAQNRVYTDVAGNNGKVGK